MNKRIVHIGFAGSGFAARFHLDALQHVFNAKIEIAGVYSVAENEAKAFAACAKAEVFNSLDDLIRHSDVVHVCTPPATHESIVIAALEQNKHVIVEKPFTGYFGNGDSSFNGDRFSREEGLRCAVESVHRMLGAERKSKGHIMYAENWIYAPAIQKEREVIEKSGAQILRMLGEQSHSGSHSLAYGQWMLSGGGSMIGKGCHPISAMIYLKYVEGRCRYGKPIRPRTVSARVHAITRMETYEDKGHLKRHYKDTEDFAAVHIVFEDGTFADAFASELVLGGTKNQVEIMANNHRTICNMSPNSVMQSYTPDETYYKDIYVVEKTETKQGWSNISPDEGWFLGYQHEMNAFYDFVVNGTPIESNSELAADTISVIYSAYLSAERNGEEVEITNLLMKD